MAVTAYLAVRFKPQTVALDSISYEQVQAKVADVETRTVRGFKHSKKTYYDVHLKVDDKQYKWTAPYDPKFRKGFQYSFYVCDGRIYRTEQEMMNELTIRSSSTAFKVCVLISLLSFSLMATLFFVFLLRKRRR